MNHLNRIEKKTATTAICLIDASMKIRALTHKHDLQLQMKKKS